MDIEVVMKRMRCKRTKCNKQDKLQTRALKSFRKKEAKKCPKTRKNYLECSHAFYNVSEYKRLSDDYDACVEKHCSESKKRLKKR